MRLGHRAKLLLLAALFALPIVASFVTYRFFRPEATANYGELLLPPSPVTAHPFGSPAGGDFRFAQLQGKWLLVASDSGNCSPPCARKLDTMRQVRLALGRNAARVERVFVVDDLAAPSAATLAHLDGGQVALTPRALPLPPGAANDRAHIYLIDPRGNVMMRWPAEAELPRMKKDLERLLKASQMG